MTRFRVDAPDFVPQQALTTPDRHSSSSLPQTADRHTNISTPFTSPDASRTISDPFIAPPASDADLCLAAARSVLTIPCPAAQSYVLPPLPDPAGMDPLSLWNRLYEIERDLVQTVLQPHFDRSLTGTTGLFPHLLTISQQTYVDQARALRIRAAATQIPVREFQSDEAWIRELRALHAKIWELPAYGGFDPVILERKRDFERAIAEILPV